MEIENGVVMSDQEFMQLHGEGTWKMLVEPRQQNVGWSPEMKKHANVIVDFEIWKLLAGERLRSRGLLEAEVEWEANNYAESWEDFLLRTIFSQEHYDEKLAHSIRSTV